MWSGVPIGKKPLPRLELDGNLVHSKVSFYCAIGETFMGHRGYAGGNLDAFWDCLINFDYEGHDQILYIKNYTQVKKVLDQIELEGSKQSYSEIFFGNVGRKGF